MCYLISTLHKYCLIFSHSPSLCFSGGGGVCPYNDPGGPQRYWKRLFPVFHRLYDQRDCWHGHCWAGCGILPHPGNWQGMCVYVLSAYQQIFLGNTNLFYSSYYFQVFAMPLWLMIYNCIHELKMEKGGDCSNFRLNRNRCRTQCEVKKGGLHWRAR